jgi:uncharacterized OB-fold protein
MSGGKQVDMVSRNEFIAALNRGRVLLYRCDKCSNIQLATVEFCSRCGSNNLTVVESDGRGRVLTYTILHVPPEGFEGYSPYGWAVIRLDDGINISAFIDIKSSEELPILSKVKITGYDERGIVASIDN